MLGNFNTITTHAKRFAYSKADFACKALRMRTISIKISQIPY